MPQCNIILPMIIKDNIIVCNNFTIISVFLILVVEPLRRGNKPSKPLRSEKLDEKMIKYEPLRSRGVVPEP